MLGISLLLGVVCVLLVCCVVFSMASTRRSRLLLGLVGLLLVVSEVLLSRRRGQEAGHFGVAEWWRHCLRLWLIELLLQHLILTIQLRHHDLGSWRALLLFLLILILLKLLVHEDMALLRRS